MQPSAAAQSRLHGRRLFCSVFGRGAAAHMRPCALRRAVLLSLAGRHGLEARATVSTRAHTHLPGTKRIRHHPVDVLAVSVIASAFVTVKHPLQLRVLQAKRELHGEGGALENQEMTWHLP